MTASIATTADSVPLPKPDGDFPTWLPPMLVKELRQGLRTRGFVIVFIVFQVLMALLLMGAIVGQDAALPGMRASISTTINGFFWTLLTVQLLIVTPARALGSLQLEMDSRAIDLLLLTRLSAWRIVVGKWGSLMGQALLLLVAMLPYGIVRYFSGSVDLVSDAQICLALLGGCAVLTAAGLWSSGMSKVLRVVFGFIGIVAFQAWRPMMVGLGVPGFGATSPVVGSDALMWAFDAALLLVFFLVAAVRRVAPLAENHAPLARALPLAALLSLPIWARNGWTNVLSVQAVFTGVFSALLCAVELSNTRLPMLVHVRPWQKRGTWGRFVGRFVLPGWPSALIFTALIGGLSALALQAAPGGSTSSLPGGSRLLACWIVTLVFGALVFPTLALALFPRTAARSATSLYTLTFGAMSIVALSAGVMAAAFPLRYAALVLYARVLPVSGLWLTVPKADDLSTKAVICQAVLLVITFAVVAWRTRDYWRHVLGLEARGALEKS